MLKLVQLGFVELDSMFVVVVVVHLVVVWVLVLIVGVDVRVGGVVYWRHLMFAFMYGILFAVNVVFRSVGGQNVLNGGSGQVFVQQSAVRLQFIKS